MSLARLWVTLSSALRITCYFIAASHRSISSLSPALASSTFHPPRPERPYVTPLAHARLMVGVHVLVCMGCGSKVVFLLCAKKASAKSMRHACDLDMVVLMRTGVLN